MGNCEGKCLLRASREDIIDIRQALLNYEDCKTPLKYAALMAMISVVPLNLRGNIPQLPDIYPDEKLVKGYTVALLDSSIEIPLHILEKLQINDVQDEISKYVTKSSHAINLTGENDISILCDKSISRLSELYHTYKEITAFRSGIRIKYDEVLYLCNELKQYFNGVQRLTYERMINHHRQSMNMSITMGSGCNNITVVRFGGSSIELKTIFPGEYDNYFKAIFPKLDIAQLSPVYMLPI